MNLYVPGCVNQFVLQTSCLCVFRCIRVSLRLQSKIKPRFTKFHSQLPVLLSLSALFFLCSTVHCTFVCGFRFLWINLSRCCTLFRQTKGMHCALEVVHYLDFHLAGQHRKHIDFTWLLSLCRSLQGPEQEQPILMSQFALNSHVFMFHMFHITVRMEN